VETYKRIGRRDAKGGDHVPDEQVLWRGQVIDMTDGGTPMIIPGNHVLESLILDLPSPSPSRDNINAKVGLTDEKASNDEGGSTAPATGGLIHLVMTK
jgi:hypothetical protein